MLKVRKFAGDMLGQIHPAAETQQVPVKVL